MAHGPPRIFCQDDLETKLYHTALETAENYSRQRLQSHLKFIRRELLHKLLNFSVNVIVKNGYAPFLSFLGHTKVGQIASVNVST